MIADAVEAVHVLMWAMAGWIVVFAAAVTLLVLAVCAAVAWVWRALPALTVRVRRPRRRPAPLASTEPPTGAPAPAQSLHPQPDPPRPERSRS